jgi:predicted metallopeptidase
MTQYIEATEIKQRAIEIAKKLNLTHIDFDRVHFYYYHSDTRTIAKITGFFKTLQLAYPHIQPFYVITVNQKNFFNTSKKEQDSTILHELLHIPKTFSGEYSRIAHNKIREMSRSLI